MKTESTPRALAEEIVHLIQLRQRKGMSEAIALLRLNYPGRPRLVTRAYEVACRVVLKRLMEAEGLHPEVELKPEADWLALQASQALNEGNPAQAFSLLRVAGSSGARISLCRSVVFQLLRRLDPSDRITEVIYAPREILTFEVGRLAGSGLILLQNPPRKKSPQAWQEAETDSRPLATETATRVHLRSETEVRSDLERGLLSVSRTGNSPLSLERIDWHRYVSALSVAQES